MQTLAIVLRLFHVISAVFWVGGLTLLTVFITPAIGATGQVGEKFMQYLMGHTKLTVFMPGVGLVTVLSGLALYWRNTSMSAGTFASSPPGMTYGVGGLAGIIALIVGVIMIGRSGNELGRIGAVIGASGGPPSSEQVERIAVLRGRITTGNQVTWALMLVAVSAMAVARYL